MISLDHDDNSTSVTTTGSTGNGTHRHRISNDGHGWRASRRGQATDNGRHHVITNHAHHHDDRDRRRDGRQRAPGATGDTGRRPGAVRTGHRKAYSAPPATGHRTHRGPGRSAQADAPQSVEAPGEARPERAVSQVAQNVAQTAGVRRPRSPLIWAVSPSFHGEVWQRPQTSDKYCNGICHQRT